MYLIKKITLKRMKDGNVHGKYSFRVNKESRDLKKFRGKVKKQYQATSVELEYITLKK